MLFRFTAIFAFVLVGPLTVGSTIGQEIERGKLKSLDVEKRQLIVTVDGKDRELTLTDSTQVLGASGKDLAEKLKDFKPESDIFFRLVTRDGKQVVQGLKLAAPGERTPGDRPRADGARVSPDH